jgi:hypothetical protein
VRTLRPEPSRGWIRYVPRRWPGAQEPWIDLSRGSLGAPDGGAGDLEALAVVELDDTLYLPPVRDDLRAIRDRVATAHRDRGTPVVVQVLPGEPGPEVPCLVVLDPLLPIAKGEPIEAGVPNLLWPLVPGRTAAIDLPGGIHHVLPVALDPSPPELRRLAETLPDPEEGWALFHRRPPTPAEALARLRELGIQPFLPRPLPDPPWPGRTNRFLAAGLAIVGELGHHFGAPASRSEAFLRAARFADQAEHDLGALARDGNLDVLPWLADEPRALVEWLLREGEGMATWGIWEWVEGRGA